MVQALRRCIIGFTLLWKNTMMNNPDFIPFNQPRLWGGASLYRTGDGNRAAFGRW
ncbi:hypothetical protein INT82_04595 [Mannheimia haemolytica]|nr:hypothetical protein [Mannheimia haemolytica]